MNKKKSNIIIKQLFSSFASIKLSFFLFLTLAIISILGTIIPQKESSTLYQKLYGHIGEYLIANLKLDDIYHAPYYFLLLFLLTINLIICSLNRLPETIKHIKKIRDNPKKLSLPSCNFTIPGTLADNAKFANLILSNFFNPATIVNDEKEKIILFAQKGIYARFCVYLIHISILIIFLGTINDSFLGFSGQVYINEGEQINSIILDNGKILNLDFSLKLNKFTISFYPNGMPSEYCSNVTFFAKDSKKNIDTLIKVNAPAQYKGINFYQSSYSQTFSKILLNFIDNNKSIPIELKYNEWTPLPNGGKAFLLKIYEEIKMNNLYEGPVAVIHYQDKNNHFSTITALKTGNIIHKPTEQINFEIINIKVFPKSGLRVTYSPGVWLVWIGCSLMLLGFLTTFYSSHRKIWISLTPVEKNSIDWNIIGSSNKNRAKLRRVINKIAREAQNKQLKEQISGNY